MATIFQMTFSNAFSWMKMYNCKMNVLIKISLKFVPKVPIDNIPALVQIIAWCRPGDEPLSEPMMVGLLTYICVTRPPWVKIATIHVTSCKLFVSNALVCYSLFLYKVTFSQNALLLFWDWGLDKWTMFCRRHFISLALLKGLVIHISLRGFNWHARCFWNDPLS